MLERSLAVRLRPAAGRVLRRAGRWRELAGHWQLLTLLLIGALVRALFMVAFSPALFFPDSWGYITSAFAHGFLGLSLRWPVGYALLIRLLTLPGRSIIELIAAQHLVGLGCGVAIYAVLLRGGLSRWAAAAAASLVLLDGYAITLEQYVMSDTFASATMLGALLALAWGRVGARTPLSGRAAAVSGLLFAAAVLQREAALFIFPVMLAYLVWVRARWTRLAVFLACAAIPLLGYASLVDQKYDVFGLGAASGWTLYGRVASFADCRDFTVSAAARPLCETAAQRAAHPSAPDWYIWGPSPAVRLFKPASESVAQSAATNALLDSFARQAILSQPLRMASVTIADFLRYLTPGVMPYANPVSATSLPVRLRRETIRRGLIRRYLPGMRPRINPPAALLRAYRSRIHLPRPVLALLALASVGALALRAPARREVLLFSGAALLLLLGTAATGGFSLRYLLPAVAPLAIGGALAGAQLRGAWRARGDR